jgi:polysaccharide export outer membrane protein
MPNETACTGDQDPNRIAQLCLPRFLLLPNVFRDAADSNAARPRGTTRVPVLKLPDSLKHARRRAAMGPRSCVQATEGLTILQIMVRVSSLHTYFFRLFAVVGILSCFQLVAAQNNTPPQQGAAGQSDAAKETSGAVNAIPSESPEKKSVSQEGRSPLLIGPGDEVEIAVYGAPDLSEHTRVSAGGNIAMPLIGYVQIAGLSSSEAEGAIEAKLRQNNVVNDPQVSVYVKEYTSSGFSVAGEVAKPGFYSAIGPHRLYDVLQAAGGPTDRAANKVLITHRDEKDVTTVDISKDPAEMAANNVDLQPGDTVVVPKAGIVYVLGEVTRPGGYVLNSTGGITVLQVVAAAGGPTHVASAGKTRLLHRTETGFKEEPVNLKKLLRGQVRDIAVHDQDIVFIPTSGVKSALNASALVATAGTAAIYRVPF